MYSKKSSRCKSQKQFEGMKILLKNKTNAHLPYLHCIMSLKVIRWRKQQYPSEQACILSSSPYALLCVPKRGVELKLDSVQLVYWVRSGEGLLMYVFHLCMNFTMIPHPAVAPCVIMYTVPVTIPVSFFTSLQTAEEQQQLLSVYVCVTLML